MGTSNSRANNRNNDGCRLAISEHLKSIGYQSALIGHRLVSEDGGFDSKNLVECSVCLEEFNKIRHCGISCYQGHYYCLKNGCTKAFIDFQLANGEICIPIKCSTCNSAIRYHPDESSFSDSVLARSMTVEQSECYMRLNATKAANEGLDGTELLVICPASDCKYYEYRAASLDDVLLVYCQNPTCLRISCVVCKQMIRLSDMADNGDEVYENFIIFHTNCLKLGQYKAQFEDALAPEQGQPCPSCSLRGKKNYGDCCHMNCPQCSTEWCYFCGRSREQLEMQQDIDFYDHYNGEDSVCLLYLGQVYGLLFKDDADDVDDIERERIVDEYLTKLLTLEQLKKLKTELGEDIFQALWNQFPMVRHCGYSVEEIDATNSASLGDLATQLAELETLTSSNE